MWPGGLNEHEFYARGCKWGMRLAGGDEDGQIDITNEGHRHALAALALHGQIFGFTREDVQILRTIELEYIQGGPFSLTSMADRIEALLPPAD